MKKLRKLLKPGCLIKPVTTSDAKKRWTFHEYNEIEGTLSVSLHKSKQDKTFGLTISGGCDKDQQPYISAIRQDGLAHQSKFFAVGDLILTLGGNDVLVLNHIQILKIVQSSGDTLSIKTKYTLSQKEKAEKTWKIANILLRNDFATLPLFTIKGGVTSEAIFTRPVVVDTISTQSNVEKSGVVFPGDEVVSIHTFSANEISQENWCSIFQKLPHHYQLTIRFETLNCRFVQTGESTFVGELFIPSPTIPVGIILSVSSDLEETSSAIIISEIIDGSIADRCGELHVGDILLSVNNISLNGISLEQASQIISNPPSLLRIEVFKQNSNHKQTAQTSPNQPVNQLHAFQHSNYNYENNITKSETNLNYNRIPYTKNYQTFDSKSDSMQYSLLKKVSQQNTTPNRMFTLANHKGYQQKISSTAHSSINTLTNTLRKKSKVRLNERVETVEVQVESRDIGLELVNDVELTGRHNLVVVDKKESNTPSTLDVIQVGDRIVQINEYDATVLTPIEFYNIIQEIELPFQITIEFDISDSIIPTQGLFSVKMSCDNNPSNFGLTLKRPGPNDEQQYLRISDIEKASPSYRLGILRCGDQLISINKHCVSHADPEDAYKLMKQSKFFAEMTFKKDEFPQGPTFAVELVRGIDSLGITIAGSEQPFDPIYVSAMSKEGLAYKSHAIQLDDVILAINDVSLRGKSLQEAYQILQGTQDVVKLLIKRKGRKNMEKEDKPQVWTWTGDNPVHVVNHQSSISMVLDKENVETGNEVAYYHTSSDSDVEVKDRPYRSKYRKAKRSVNTPSISRTNSLPGSQRAGSHRTTNSSPSSRRNSSSTKNSTSSLLEQEILEVAMKTSRPSSPMLNRKSVSASSLPPSLRVFPIKNLSNENSSIYTSSAPKLNRRNFSTSYLTSSKKVLSPLIASSDNILAIGHNCGTIHSKGSSCQYFVSPGNVPSSMCQTVAKKHGILMKSMSHRSISSTEKSSENVVGRFHCTPVLPHDAAVCGVSGVLKSNCEPSKSSHKSLKSSFSDVDDDVFFQPTTKHVSNISSQSFDVANSNQFEPSVIVSSTPCHDSPWFNSNQSENSGMSSNIVHGPLEDEPKNKKIENFFLTRMQYYQNPSAINSPLESNEVTSIDGNRGGEISLSSDDKFTKSELLDKQSTSTQENQENVELNGNVLQETDTPNIKKRDVNSATLLHKIVLKKNKDSDHFGFSVSESVHDSGVFVRAVEPNSLAHLNGNIRKFDRIVKVNGTDTRHMNCNDILPLIQVTENAISLEIERYSR